MKNVIAVWFCGFIALAAVVFGIRRAAACAASALPTGTAGFGCMLAEGIKPIYTVGCWVTGLLFVMALIMTVVQLRRDLRR